MRTQPTSGSWLLVGIAALCLLLGFWAFAYEGYTEDGGSTPIQSWPYGAALFAAAGALILGAIRRTRPDLSGGSFLLVVALTIVALVLAALGSLDAGGHSFEF